MEKFHFTFKNIESQYQIAIDKGYNFITCAEYAKNQSNNFSKTIINRIDIDQSVKKAEKLGEIYRKLRIKGTFFIRLHATEYNPFSFENYRIIKNLIHSGHEIGYHSEIVDQAVIWDEDAEDNLVRDIEILNRIFNVEIKGVASHGGMTGLNNLDFWKDKNASDFGLLYEAYEWFTNTFYISDSEWTRWKCYNKGKLVAGDIKSFGGHIQDKDHALIYLLIHSDTYYNKNYYED